MNEIQTATNALLQLVMTGGAKAEVELSKKDVIGCAKQLSKLWRTLFSTESESYPLAHRLAYEPDNGQLQ